MHKHTNLSLSQPARKSFLVTVLCAGLSLVVHAQPAAVPLLEKEDLEFLETLTRVVIDSSRILPGQKVSSDFGPNNTNGTLIRPGGRTSYPSFWIRDYAMSIESGYITLKEQKHMLLLTASTQSNKTVITDGGSMIPIGAIADHIRIDDGQPIYFPGTYDVLQQGNKTFGMFPPFCDQFFFIHMAYEYLRSSKDESILKIQINGSSLVDRLVLAFDMVPTRMNSTLVYTTDDFRGVDFGFRDVISMTGSLAFPSILKYRAAIQLSVIMNHLKRKEEAQQFATIASKLKAEITDTFLDQRGMLNASTGKSRQADVWSTVLAIDFGILNGKTATRAANILKAAYEAGQLARRGNIRHVIATDDYNSTTAWESSLAEKESYQNGGYWGTPIGWVCASIALVDVSAAKKLAKEYIDELRREDFRKGPQYGAPWECYNKEGAQNPVYMTTVTCPLVVFRKLSKK